ncbi:MAG: hypothetical protein K2N38_01055 [Oscillospiraceae bacterium]|nr:hypothetical protein [Oscillospiraceae bacterium]
MTIKKLSSVLLASVMLLDLTGCGGLNSYRLTVTLNGIVVTKPLTAETLGEGYSVKDYLLYYNGEPVAGVTFTEKTADREEDKREIRSLVIGVNSGAENDTLSVDGITLGSDMSEVLDTFGEPSLREAGKWFFSENGMPENEEFLGVKFDDNKKVTWLYVRVK